MTNNQAITSVKNRLTACSVTVNIICPTNYHVKKINPPVDHGKPFWTFNFCRCFLYTLRKILVLGYIKTPYSTPILLKHYEYYYPRITANFNQKSMGPYVFLQNLVTDNSLVVFFCHSLNRQTDKLNFFV